MSRLDPQDPASLRVLRHFFERQLNRGDTTEGPCPSAQERCEYLVAHLVERTIARAALRRAVRRPLGADAPAGAWKETLRAAALTALRRRPQSD
jgi:hypothetical protein